MLEQDKGQGLFEFLLFLPFMLMMYQITLTMGNAINGSINQQKFARGYMFARIKFNSNIPSPSNMAGTGVTQYGLYFTGWTKELNGANPVAPCYEFKTILNPGANVPTCDQNYTGNTTQLIRVQTVVGICSTTYLQNTSSGTYMKHSDFAGDLFTACQNM